MTSEHATLGGGAAQSGTAAPGSKTDYYYETLREMWNDENVSAEEMMGCLTDSESTADAWRRMFEDYVEDHPEGRLTDAEVWEVHARLLAFFTLKAEEENA